MPAALGLWAWGVRLSKSQPKEVTFIEQAIKLSPRQRQHHDAVMSCLISDLEQIAWSVGIVGPTNLVVGVLLKTYLKDWDLQLVRDALAEHIRQYVPRS